ncbi:Mo-dependent nitrogenase C-terminal domain-containing protein [Thermostichus vulcanus]|uniref:Nitrogenase n=1 Tax=Thermostichus vulcanus str. 'Rupite' TaxID=2813851 RepID=A0ABT0C838_THEVL|nr:Mo-dependent nitrogenase C-terminal domain-containing protein [Thermostichus vulcanus]MCJ2541916.1 nitrogenase [Thermostichus vulcanus str. 'Rupite']
MTSHSPYHLSNPSQGHLNPFTWLVHRLRHWLDGIAITNPRQAAWICRLIPASCPFERDIRLGSRTVHIPALCRINPLYEQLIALRLRASSYLVQSSRSGFSSSFQQPDSHPVQESPSCP